MRALAEVETNHLLTDGEQHRRHRRAGRHVAPAQTHVGQETKQQRKQPRRHHERHQRVDDVPQRRRWQGKA